MDYLFNSLCKSKSGKGAIIRCQDTRVVSINGSQQEMTRVRFGLLWANQEVFEGLKKGDTLDLEGLELSDRRIAEDCDIFWID